MPVPYAALDPGIVEAVRFLNDCDFTTTDSGDGVSKPKVDGVLDFAHVVVRVEVPADVTFVADNIRRLDWGYVDRGAPTMIEASYSAIDGVALVMVGWPR